MIGSMLGVALAAAPTEPSALRSSVVVVQQGGATCAGVVLDDGSVATAYHCVAGGFGARIEHLDGTRTRATVVATDPAHDIALLDPPERRSGGLSLGIAPEVGDDIAIVGHPYAAAPPLGFLEGTLRWSTTRGQVAAVGARSLQLDVTLGPGNSGGPVVDDEHRVVGIVSRRIGDGLGFAGRAEALDSLRDEPRRRALGGTVTASLAGWGGVGGRPVVGADLELTWRDRIVIGVRSGLPVAPLVRALAGNDVEATVALGRAGLRLPIGTGPGSVSIEAFGALGLTQTWSPEARRQARAIPDLQTGVRPDGFVGLGLGRGGLAFEAAWRIGAEPGSQTAWLLGLRLGAGALRRVW